MGVVATKRRSMGAARRLRIFEAHGGGICGWCHEAIEGDQAFEIDHAVPLWFGGSDDDGPNAYPIHRHCHHLKTFGRERDRRRYSDLSNIAKTKRLRAARLGLAPPGRGGRLSDPRLVRKIDGRVVERDGLEGGMG